MERADALGHQIASTVGYSLEQQMKSIGRMTEMCARNSVELRVAIAAVADPRFRSPMSKAANDDIDEPLLEVARRLDNYLASAISRVERTEVLVTMWRGIDPQFEQERRQRSRALNDEPTWLLVNYLRNHSVHVGYHAIWCEFVVALDPDYVRPPGAPSGRPSSITARLFLTRPSVPRGRTRAEKQRADVLNAFDERLEIEPLVRQFNSVSDGFIVWYFDRLKRLHTIHSPEVEALRVQLRALLP